MNFIKPLNLGPAYKGGMPPQVEELLWNINLEFDYLSPLERSTTGPWSENRIKILKGLVNELENIVRHQFTGPATRKRAS